MQVFSQKCITLNKQYKTNHAAPKERVTHTHTHKKNNLPRKGDVFKSSD